jgi:formylglycine-generating enzyme required for sulfatase activity
MPELAAAVDGLLSGSASRYEEHVAPQMRLIDAAQFEMGTDAAEARHFCGESPRHHVELSSFELARVPVTNELFGTFDASRLDVRASDRQKPVVDVTWLEASLFALWVGCRLPTEAEWEFACAAGSDGEWCCDDEAELPLYAWCSENAAGHLGRVATRRPNVLGLFDLHGNVWEWCTDAYDQDFYGRSPILDPVCLDPPRDRVCRGGSFHALPEMCRTRYRLHEPANFWAADLGFRLARSASTQSPGDG